MFCINVFDLYAKIALDTSEYTGGLEDASNKTNSFGSTIKNGLEAFGKAAAVGLTAATTAVTALGKASLEGYAEYEQLTGGIETLFKTSADVVQQYADNAYKTAGMSANEYMSTVTSFSASLLQSLGGDTAAAAEKADQAITDMSDNANKMGTSMEMIQNAYQGFAKQNFTMLDNLKLGYGGTKEEMARLLEDAEKLSGIEYDLSSYADIVDALHVIQTEMDITGTTATEASETISGSLAAAKSAWSNLVTGIANENANLEVLIGNFVDSVGTAASNIIPRVEQILAGVGALVTKLAPIIAEQVPALITNVLPSFLEAGVSMLTGIIDGITSALPALVEAAVPILLTLVDGIIEQLPKLLEAGLEIILTLATGIVDALPSLVERVPEIIVSIVTTLIANLPQILDVGVQIIGGLIQGIIQAIVSIPAAIAQVVKALVDGFKSLLGIHSPSTVFAEIGGNLIAGLLQGITNAWQSILTFFSGAVEALKSFFATAWENIKQGAVTAWEGIKTALAAAWDAIQNVWSGVVSFFSGIWDGVVSVFSGAADFFGQVFSGAWNAVTAIWNAAVSFFSDIWAGISGIFSGVASFFGGIFTDAWNAIKSAWTGVKEFFSGIWNNITNVFSNVGAKFKEIGGNIVSGLKNGVMNAWSTFTSWLSSKVSGLISGVKGLLGINSPSTVFAGIGQNMAQGLVVGWDDEYDSVQKKIESGLDFSAKTAKVSADVSADAAGGTGNAQSSRGGDTYNFYSPKALDPVSAAREMKKARQQLALGYV